MPPTETGRARALFPNARFSYGFEEGVYHPITRSFGHVLVDVTDADYSGDTRILLQKNDTYGFLVVGWGSCSGCDRLQACRSYAEVDALIEDIEGNIKWFGSLAKLTSYIADSNNRELQFYYHSANWPKFVSAVLAYEEQLLRSLNQ